MITDEIEAMTREEIENALLANGSVKIGTEDGECIELDELSSRRLASVVFDQLRLSTVDDLKENMDFFQKLEAAYRQSGNGLVPEGDSEETLNSQLATLDLRTWYLKKVETRGFGGLNAKQDDIFEFDVAGRSFCLEGQNGSGKSSLANAVLFAMTGKIYRDQYGILDDPTRADPVIAHDDTTLNIWPSIATYPSDWGSEHIPVDVSATLTFANDIDNEEIKAERHIHGEPGAPQHDVSIDPKLTAVPTLIEAGLLMPMRIQHIRVPEADDNGQLIGLIRQLIGLEPLLNVAELVDKLVHRGQRFLKYARDNGAENKAKRVSQLLNDAQEKISELETSLDLRCEVDAKKLIPENRLKELGAAEEYFNRQQAEGFKQLATVVFEGFDPVNANHRKRVTDAINQISVDATRYVEISKSPAVLKEIELLSKRIKDENFFALKSTLQKAERDLDSAVEWSRRQKEDTLLRLKAVAATHFEECEDPLCPLCMQSIKHPDHHSLVENLRVLKKDAELAQVQLGDACRRIEQSVRNAAKNLGNYIRK